MRMSGFCTRLRGNFGIFPVKKKISSFKSLLKMDYGGKAGDYSAQDPSTAYSGKLRNQIVVLMETIADASKCVFLHVQNFCQTFIFALSTCVNLLFYGYF